MFYVLRFHPTVDLNFRRHSQTLGRFSSWEDAEQERSTREQSGDLVVEGPRVERRA